MVLPASIARFLGECAPTMDKLCALEGGKRVAYNMVSYNVHSIVIRDLRESDAQIITEEEIAQGWDATIEKYKMRLKHQNKGKCISLVAEWNGHIAGYINVDPDSAWCAFAHQGYADIVDFGVFKKGQRHGIGGRLMDVAEQIAFSYAGVVYLGVGLHISYGSAQRGSIKRGYIPDGGGVWYKDQVGEPYANGRNDDDLVLYLYKHQKKE